MALSSLAASMAAGIFLCFWAKTACLSNEGNCLTQRHKFCSSQAGGFTVWVLFLCSPPADRAGADWQNLAKAPGARSFFPHGQTHSGERWVQTAFVGGGNRCQRCWSIICLDFTVTNPPELSFLAARVYTTQGSFLALLCLCLTSA